VASHIGKTPGAIHLRTDVERKLMFNLPLSERLSSEHYTPEVRSRVYQRLLPHAESILQSGHSVIFDAVFSETACSDAVRDLAARLGVVFQGIWLEAAPAELMARVTQREGDASDAGQRVLAIQLNAGSCAPTGWSRVNTSGTLDEATHRLLDNLRRTAPNRREKSNC
jgi:predicted kinase